ncbi:MAG: hypothetical protein AAGB46_09110 [Verrucomicrobiota bacterium]
MMEDRAGGRAKGESREHRTLKRLARGWMRERGFRISATEVRIPLSAYRADVAGYCSRRIYTVSPGETMVVECKATRADFLRDSGVESEVLEERIAIEKRLKGLVGMMRMHLPQCRMGVSLFAEYDSYDFGTVRHEVWRRLASQFDLLGRKFKEGLKLSKLSRYSSANYFCLAVEAEVLKKAEEVPEAWGILVREGDGLIVLREPLRMEAKEEVRLKLLERIGARNTRWPRLGSGRER